MIGGLRKLVSLPALWAGQLLAMLRSPAAASLLGLAWEISGDGAVARSALFLQRKYAGLPAALAWAQAWMARRPRPEIASWLGVVAAECGDLDRARQCLQVGRSLGDDPAGLLDLLELWVANEAGEPGEYAALLAAMEARRDLSAAVRKEVLERRLLLVMLDGRLEEARRRAKLLLEIGTNPQAEVVMWALARRAGDSRAAERHLRAAQALPEPQRLYRQCLASAGAGAADDAAEILAALDAKYPDAAAGAREALAAKEATP